MFLGYNEQLRKISDFKRKKLPPMWNVLVSILNKSLTCKLGSQDQASTNILTVMYGMFYNRNLDYASLIFQEIASVINQRNTYLNKNKELPALMFPRFISLFIAPALDHPHIPSVQPFCKISTMSSHKPTIDTEGYRTQRELSRYMLDLIPQTSSILTSYRSSMVLSEQRVPTPEPLEPRVESEGESENELEKNLSEPPSDSTHAERLLKESEEDVLRDTYERFQLSPPRANSSAGMDANTSIPIEK